MEREARVEVSLSGLTLAHATDEKLFFTAGGVYLHLEMHDADGPTDLTLRFTVREDGIELDDLHVM